MAIYNEILAPRYARAITRILGMKGVEAMRQVSGELTPVLPFFYGAENRTLEGWNRFAAAFTVAAVAAQTGAARVRNPAGSNVIGVFEKIVVSEVTADQPTLQLGAFAADLAGPAGAQRLDARQAIVLSNLITSSSGTGVSLGGGTAISRTALAVNSSYDFIGTDIQEIPLAPGDALQVIGNVANQAIQVSFMWRERFLEESERQVG